MVFATWVDEDGSILAANSSVDEVCVTLVISPFVPGSEGEYRCEVRSCSDRVHLILILIACFSLCRYSTLHHWSLVIPVVLGF